MALTSSTKRSGCGFAKYKVVQSCFMRALLYKALSPGCIIQLSVPRHLVEPSLPEELPRTAGTAVSIGEMSQAVEIPRHQGLRSVPGRGFEGSARCNSRVALCSAAAAEMIARQMFDCCS